MALSKDIGVNGGEVSADSGEASVEDREVLDLGKRVGALVASRLLVLGEYTEAPEMRFEGVGRRAR